MVPHPCFASPEGAAPNRPWAHRSTGFVVQRPRPGVPLGPVLRQMAVPMAAVAQMN